jgi:hypothetical protein
VVARLFSSVIKTSFSLSLFLVDQTAFTLQEDPVPAMMAEITNAGVLTTITFRLELDGCNPPECVNGFLPMDGAPSVNLPLTSVANVANLGCEMADFVGTIYTDKIALIKRGECDYSLKVANAENAGAVGAVVYNDGADESRFGMVIGNLLGSESGGPFVPTVGISYADGMALFSAGESKVSMIFEIITIVQSSSNFILKTKAGSTDSVLLVDTYRDSEPGSPGVNDALSGPSAVITLVEAMMESEFIPKNQIIFLLYSGVHTDFNSGYFYWLNSISFEEFESISMELEINAIASPNGIRFFVSSSELATDFMKGSFENLGLSYTYESLNPENFPFPYVQILSTPGFFENATKTTEEAELFGGDVGEPYDPW